ncbi:hypothetical protein ABW19_dt0201548 [Dactylella cylindrospora]|nr:hypothetical protein ABW19_dt0201548 [Dactylella cylindrospora]
MPPLTVPPMATVGAKLPDVPYKPRSAVRIIALHPTKDSILLVHVTNGDYYKLPGGGIESFDTSHHDAAIREAKEETGCIVKIDATLKPLDINTLESVASPQDVTGLYLGDPGCIGIVEEWRFELHQYSYCYVGQVADDTGMPELTEDEAICGFVHKWVPLADAVTKIRDVEGMGEKNMGWFTTRRDSWLVSVYLRIVERE